MEVGPCATSSPWLIAFNATLNVLQAVLLALVAQRAVRKNREEAKVGETDAE